MATTTPTPAAGINWTNILTLIEGFGNLALVGLQAGGVVPVGSSQIAALLEQALNNLVTQQQAGAPATTDVVNAYALLIAGFKAYQIATVSNSALQTKIGVYLTATEAGLAGYVQAGAGFNAANYGPLEPVA